MFSMTMLLSENSDGTVKYSNKSLIDYAPVKKEPNFIFQIKCKNTSSVCQVVSPMSQSF